MAASMTCARFEFLTGIAEEMSLVECYDVSLGEWGEWFLMFQQIVLPSSSGSGNSTRNVFQHDPEDDTTLILQNAGNTHPSSTV